MVNVLKISQINYYIKSMLESDKNLIQVYVYGEVSNLTKHRTGHIYLSLKDEKSVLKAIIFNGIHKLKFDLQEGMNIIARGRISVYEPSGQYQIIIEDIQPDGVGSMAIAFEQLKQKLKDEGLFDENHKKTIPYMPKTIGVITSPTGAVIQDIRNVLSRRFPLTKVLLYGVLVQGEGAPSELIKAVQYFDKAKNVDVIIICRGGGSTEDLSPFNDENLARVIYNADIPIISAVGHETDFTICDFVADLRAPTPSAAAEIVVPNRYDILEEISNMDIISHTKDYIVNYQYEINDLLKRLLSAYENIIYKQKQELKMHEVMLETLNPENIINRGYSLLYKENNIITTIDEISVNDKVKVLLKNGEIECSVLDIKEGRK